MAGVSVSWILSAPSYSEHLWNTWFSVSDPDYPQHCFVGNCAYFNRIPGRRRAVFQQCEPDKLDSPSFSLDFQKNYPRCRDWHWNWMYLTFNHSVIGIARRRAHHRQAKLHEYRGTKAHSGCLRKDNIGNHVTNLATSSHLSDWPCCVPPLNIFSAQKLWPVIW